MAATKSSQPVEKCHFCKGEMDLLAIPSICSYCRGMFCNQHKLPRSHGCSYKYKKPAAAASAAARAAAAPAQTSSTMRAVPAQTRPAPAEAARPMAATAKQHDQSGHEQWSQQHHQPQQSQADGQKDEDVVRGVDGPASRWTLFKRRLFGGR